MESYQVFINHRGKDTKLTVGSLIYHALEPYGLRVFLDQYVLCPGDTIETEIRGAISSSSIHIAIFSKNYAESRWCLKELCWMLTSSHEPWFIPIFCDVEPWELSFVEKGCYANAFEKHFQRAREEENTTFKEVVEWKEALRKAAGISGKVVKGKEALGKAANNCDTVFKWKESDDYGKLVENIKKTVMEHVKRDPLELPPNPVGLDEAWKDLQDQIKKESFKKLVVMAGLGGIGKSTLATHIFNELSRSEFRRACFLSNVRETHDLTSLQWQLSRDLVGIDQRIANTNEGKTMLRKNLKGLKVLIVFDDVDKWDKIERVLDVHAVEEGSLIFVTSRDKDIVRASYKNTSFVYDVEPLKNEHARELLHYHATRQSNSLEECPNLVEHFLKICGGSPLFLQGLGEQLSRRSDIKHWEWQFTLCPQRDYGHWTWREHWEWQLEAIHDVINKLKWSYEGMDKEKLRMLLDVAYFLVGEDTELAVQVLEGLGYMNVHHSLKRLCETYLISFQNDRKIWESSSRQMFLEHSKALPSLEESLRSGENPLQSLSAALTKRSSKIIMHNQVREMARFIVREDERGPLRLSCPLDILQQSGSLSREVRGICIREDQSPSQLPVDINITGVRLLLVEHYIYGLPTFLGSISGNLVWLRWRVSFFISLPPTISVKNLRVLELKVLQDDLQDDRLEKFFSSFDEIPLDLRVLHMGCTGHASSSTSSTAQPVDLQLSKKSFDGSSFLRCIGTLMQNLTQIVLNQVINSESLPFDFSELKMLRHLDLSGSSYLTALPNSFSKLLQLQHLALRDCRRLSIPVDILGEISTLEHIDFKGCAQLEHLPQGIASQRRLRYLNLLETRLLELPLTLEPSYELEQLIIGSNRFRKLSWSVAFSGKLKELFLVGCFELEHISMPIEQLTCLERLEIYGSKLRILPAGISLLKHLKVLTIISCPIENFSLYNNVMDALTDLTLTNTAISDLSIPSGACPRLKVLTIISCPIENFSLDNNVMDALTDLTLTHTAISDLSIPAGACPSLEIVDLSYNIHLRKVEVSQSTIVKLNLEGCENLQHMNLPKLGRLKFLNINRCGYVAIQNVAECGSLEEITAEECRFTIEPVWSQLQRLNFFTFSDYFARFFIRKWPKVPYNVMRVKIGQEFEKSLNSYHGMTLREVPSTDPDISPVVLEKVHSHSAILMCFITHYDDFVVRFEACNGGARSQEFVIRNHKRPWLHVYMWTQRSTLFTDEDHFYDNVSIYKEGVFDVQGGGRGWILTFSSENHALDMLNQIINPSAEVEGEE